MKPENFDKQNIILSKGNSFIPGGRYELISYHAGSNPILSFNLFNADNHNLGVPFITQFHDDQWIHFAWVYNAADKSSTVFIDGLQLYSIVHQTIGTKTIENTYDLMIGCGWADDLNPVKYRFWNGQMDELRIWKRALSGYEVWSDRIAAIANANGLVAAYDFDKVTNSLVRDVSGNGHHGRLFDYGIRVIKPQLPVGIGDLNERLTAFRIIAGSVSETVKSISLNLSACSNVSDISALRIYHNGPSERLDLETATLFGSLDAPNAKIGIAGDMTLAPGDNYFWIIADISTNAREGNQVQASVLSYTTFDTTIVPVPYVEGSRKVLLTNKLLFSGGDAGSRNYRIPAIVTAIDGSLVTATDKRWKNPFDLPGHIDVVIRRSTDKGQTWSQPLTIAGEDTDTGFGDAALVVNQRNGEIICMFAADRGFFSSTASVPIRMYLSKSTDHGVSWSPPRDVTSQIYGAESANPLTVSWQGAFWTSGNATQLRSGRLLAVLPVRETHNRTISNYVIYSDDDAQNWNVSSNRASENGNEAKLVELENGYLLMSIRNAGTRLFNISKDGGITWGSPYPQTAILDPSCNGDLIRYTSVSDGYPKNRLLHSIPFSTSRTNVSVLLSYDEGVTWPVRKTIYPGRSAYSSLTILNDGTIGIYYEMGEYDTYQLYFVRFSLQWLTDGADTWINRWATNINTSVQPIENDPAYIIYPNPADDVINISGHLEMGTHVEIFNNLGILVNGVRVENPTNLIQVDLAGYTPGMYLLKIGAILYKFVVR